MFEWRAAGHVFQRVPTPPVQRVMYSAPMYGPMYGEAAAQPVVVMPQGGVPGGVPVFYPSYPPGRYLVVISVTNYHHHHRLLCHKGRIKIHIKEHTKLCTISKMRYYNIKIILKNMSETL